jgi:pimeloyl-ACP methyl ester carboxylesterase
MSDDVYPFGYNVISFDQRGMGRSVPTFVVEECTKEPYYPKGGLDEADVEDETSIRAYARLFKARNLGCWNYPGFSIPLDEDDETSKRYHFLEYSGTRQLAEDIERVRILFGGNKLSVYGISYGTAVMGTYVTIFPKHTNLMVLDGNMSPYYDIVELSDGMARSTNHRIDYFIATCEMGNQQCGVSDMGGCVNNL